MLDADSSGTVGFDDFFEFVRGRKHSLDSRWRSQPIAMELRVEVPSQHDPLTGEERRPTLDELAWDSSMGPETLRALVKEMLERRHLGPTDLLKAWDTQPTSRTASEHHKLNRDEFCSHLAELFIRSEGAQCSSDDVFDLWENEVAAVANRAFTSCGARRRKGGGQATGSTRLRLTSYASNSGWMNHDDRQVCRSRRRRRGASKHGGDSELRLEMSRTYHMEGSRGGRWIAPSERRGRAQALPLHLQRQNTSRMPRSLL